MLWWQGRESRERSNKQDWLCLELHWKLFLRFALSASSTGGILGLLHCQAALAFWLRHGRGLNLHAVWAVLSLNKQHNQRINWDNVLLKVAGDRWPSPFPCALKKADKAAALCWTNTHTLKHTLSALLTAPCLAIPAREAMSFWSIIWKTSGLQLLGSPVVPTSSQEDTQTWSFLSEILWEPSEAGTKENRKSHWKLDLAVWMAWHKTPQTLQVPLQLLLFRGSTDHCVSKPLGSLPPLQHHFLFGLGHVT